MCLEQVMIVRVCGDSLQQASDGRSEQVLLTRNTSGGASGINRFVPLIAHTMLAVQFSGTSCKLCSHVAVCQNGLRQQSAQAKQAFVLHGPITR